MLDSEGQFHELLRKGDPHILARSQVMLLVDWFKSDYYHAPPNNRSKKVKEWFGEYELGSGAMETGDERLLPGTPRTVRTWQPDLEEYTDESQSLESKASGGENE